MNLKMSTKKSEVTFTKNTQGKQIEIIRETCDRIEEYVYIGYTDSVKLDYKIKFKRWINMVRSLW